MPANSDPVLSKVWITKYALTTGVYTAEDVEQSGRMIQVGFTDRYGHRVVSYVHKPHWHETEDEARVQVQKTVDAALKSLKKRQAKLDAVMASVQGPLPTKPWGAY